MPGKTLIPFDAREHFPFRVKIRYKIIIPFVFITLVAGIVGVVGVDRLLHDQVQRLLHQEAQRSADVVYAAVDEKLRDLEALCQISARLASRPRNSEEGGGEQVAVVERVLQRAGFQMEATEGEPLPPGAIPFWHGGQGGGYGLQYHAATGGLRFFALSPLPRGRSRAVVLYAPVDAAFLASLRRQTGFDVALFVKERPYWASTLTGETLDDWFRQRIPAQDAAAADGSDAQVGGHVYFYRVFPLKRGSAVQAYCLLVRDHADLLAWLARVRRTVILAALVFAAAVTLVYAVVVRRLTLPLHQLMAAVDRVGRGDLSESAIVRSRDEIGRLSEAFQAMISSLRRNQQELQEATHQIVHQEKLASLGHLVARLMHEIKNPLNALALMIRLAGKEEDAGKRQEIMDRMEAEVRRINRTAGEFLRLARRPTISLEVLDVAERMRLFLGNLEPLIQSHGVRLQVDIEDNLPPLRVDVGHLDQILYNLVFNALHAMEGGGDLTVSARAPGSVEGGEHGRRYVRLQVADTGMGIPPEHLERVFDPFFTTKPAGQGTGLGLPIVKSVVEGYGGFVRLESRPGVGCTVEIVLPA